MTLTDPRTICAFLASSGALALVACGDVPVDEEVKQEEPGIVLEGSSGDLEPTDDGLPPDADESGTTGSDDATTGVDGSDDGLPPGDDESGSSGEPSDDDGPPQCDEQTLPLEVVRPHVVLLLDKSFSMVDNQWDHDADEATDPVTRWNSLYNVVDALAHDIEDSTDLGMVLFPSVELTENSSATACTVDGAPNADVTSGNAATIVAAMPGPDETELYGGTPTSAGMGLVLEHLAAIDDGRPQAVVLVTDGAANCMSGVGGSGVYTQYDEDLAPLVEQAFTDGVPTYVVGVDIVDAMGEIPVANPHERLSEVADAGGVPRVGGPESFYNTTDEAELLAALTAITAELSCTFELSTPAEFTGQVTVNVAGDAVPRVEACGPDGIGWRYLQDEAPYTSIELCASTCEDAHSIAELELDYACLPPA